MFDRIRVSQELLCNQVRRGESSDLSCGVEVNTRQCYFYSLCLGISNQTKTEYRLQSSVNGVGN